MREEKGAVAVIVAASLMMLFGIAAYVIDLSAIRLDRAADQRITDAAASAGALATFEDSAVQGCEDALDYVAINTPGISSLDDSACSVEFSGSCTSTSARTVTPPPAGRWSVTVVNPVPDTHTLMNPGQIGAAGHGAAGDDGDPCDRFGVQMTATETSTFGRVIGSEQNTTTVHSVARAMLPPLSEPPLNLLVLDRFGCDAIHVEGNGGVIVNEVIDPSTSEVFAGLAAADSDASSGCSPSVIHIQGSNALLRADGPTGCADEVTPGTGDGCGLIQVLAPGTPGCNPPACTPGAGGANPPIPEPTALSERMTRQQVDHLYNCWSDYTWVTATPGGVSWATSPLTTGNEQNIERCPGPTDPRIYDLIADVGPSGSSGHATWPHGCNVPASANESFTGDVHVDCADFIVEGDVTIDGNVIFEENVHVKSDGVLDIRNTSAGHGWIAFRDGELKKDGQASLIFQQMAVYMSETSWTDIAGGDKGELTWVAPSTGDFQDLALWSDSPITHLWAGQGNLQMDGVFFTPLATAEYSGSSGHNQTDAQWVADKLHARGQGQLEIQPRFDHPVKRDDSVRTVLIR